MDAISSIVAIQHCADEIIRDFDDKAAQAQQYAQQEQDPECYEWEMQLWLNKLLCELVRKTQEHPMEKGA